MRPTSRTVVWRSSVILGLGLILASCRGSFDENVCYAPAGSLDIPSLDADIVVFGEIHGNKETPEVFLAAICQYLESEDGEIRVALEFPSEIQISLNAFLGSDGGSDAVQRFLSHPFWRRASQDGRSSIAMLNLIEALRKIGASTRRLISVTAIDGKSIYRPIPYPDLSRDGVMAANITNLSRESIDDVVLALVGNAHAERSPRAETSFFTPAASLIEGELLTVLVLPESGDTWNVQSSPLREVTDLSDFEKQKRTEGSYDNVLPIGRVSSSPPAKGSANGRP